MKSVKCIGCSQLEREAQPIDKVNPKFPLIIYHCSRFPYWCALSGLLRPSKAIENAASNCSVDIRHSCIICGSRIKKNIVSYGEPNIAFTCVKHYRAWSQWLDEHLEKRDSYSPRGRVIHAKWIEVFREWVEEARRSEADL